MKSYRVYLKESASETDLVKHNTIYDATDSLFPNCYKIYHNTEKLAFSIEPRESFITIEELRLLKLNEIFGEE